MISIVIGIFGWTESGVNWWESSLFLSFTKYYVIVILLTKMSSVYFIAWCEIQSITIKKSTTIDINNYFLTRKLQNDSNLPCLLLLFSSTKLRKGDGSYIYCDVIIQFVFSRLVNISPTFESSCFNLKQHSTKAIRTILTKPCTFCRM